MSSKILGFLVFSAVGILVSPSTYAGWTVPIRISANESYEPRIKYSNGIIHIVYHDWYDAATYVRSTDLGENWSDPLDMFEDFSEYPDIFASGDSVIAVWLGEFYSWQWSNYIFKRSIDGGATWGDTSKILPSYRSDIGSAYSFCFSGPRVYFAFTAHNRGSVFFAKSTDFGMSWSSPESLYSIYSIDKLEISNFGDTLYMIFRAWISFGPDNAEIYFLRSTDVGQNWEEPSIVSLPDSARSHHPASSVNEEGALAVCWNAWGGNYYGDIFVRLSHDFGQSWDSVIATGYSNHLDGTDIDFKGDTLHLVIGKDCYITHTVSTDDGISWALADTIDFDRNYSYDPVIAVSPGRLHVIWDDRRFRRDGIYYSRWDEGYVPPDSLPRQLTMIGRCTIPFSCHAPSMCVSGHYAFIGGFHVDFPPYEGIQVVDIASPGTPILTGGFENCYQISDMEVSGNYIYCAWPLGLLVYDISNADSAVMASVDTISRYCVSVFKKDSLAFLLGDRDMFIYNVSDPYQPEALGVFEHTLDAADVVAIGEYAYLAGYNSLLIVDISDPYAPILRGYYESESYPGGYDNDVAVAANYAYLYLGYPEIEIVDISDSDNPVYAGLFLFNYGNCGQLIANGACLLAAHQDVTVLDISTPLNPAILAEHQGPPDFRCMWTDGDFLYAFTDSVFAIFEMPVVGINENGSHLATRQSLLNNYPNPFNIQTTIRYDLSKACDVTVKIFDILGRQMETLVDTEQGAGHHTVIWNAKDKPSGIYFYRMQAGAFTETKMMVLLK